MPRALGRDRRRGAAPHTAARRGGGRRPGDACQVPPPLRLPRRRSPRSPSCARGPRRPRPSTRRDTLSSSPVRRGQSRSGRRCPPRKTPSTPSGRFPPEPRSGGTGGGTYTGRLPVPGTPSVRHHLTDRARCCTAPPDARAGETRSCTGDACASVTPYPCLPTLSPGGAAHPCPYRSPWDHPPAHPALPTFSSILRVRHHRHSTQHPSPHAAHLTAGTPPPYAGATDPIPLVRCWRYPAFTCLWDVATQPQ